MARWTFNRAQLDAETDARLQETHDKEPTGGLPNFHPPIRTRRGVVEQTDIPLYKMAEGEVFSLLVGRDGTGLPPYARIVDRQRGDGAPRVFYPSGTIHHIYNVEYQARCAIYLAKLIEEDRRQLLWINRARVKFRELVDFLLTLQIGFSWTDPYISGLIAAPPIDPAYGYIVTSDHLEYGGVVDSASDEGGMGQQLININSLGTWLTIHAWWYAYKIFGDVKYQTAYRAAIKYMRRLQHPGDFRREWFVTANNAVDSRYRPGMWPTEAAMQIVTVVGFQEMYLRVEPDIAVRDIEAFEVIKDIMTYEGDSITYGDAAAITPVLVPTAAKLSTMLAEAKAFWMTPVNHSTSVFAGTKMEGFSSATPSIHFNVIHVRAPPNDTLTSGSGAWQSIQPNSSGYRPPINSLPFAQAVRGWYAAFGYDTKLHDVVDNLLFAATLHQTTQRGYPTGVTVAYNPKMALSKSFLVKTAGVTSPLMTTVSEFHGAYDWLTMGLMAHFMSEQYPADFIEAKKRISKIEDAPLKWKLPLSINYNVGETIMPGVRINTLRTTDYLFRRGFDEDVNLDAGSNFSTASISLIPVCEQDGLSAAAMGLAYREAPVIHVLKDHP